MDVDEKDARIRQGLDSLLRVATTRAQNNGKLRTSTLDADEAFLLKIAAMTQEHLETTPLDRSGNHAITLEDAVCREHREGVRESLQRFTKNEITAEETIAQVEPALENIGAPPGAVREFVGCTDSADMKRRLGVWIRSKSGPSGAAAALVANFAGREKGTNAYAKAARGGTRLEVEARGRIPTSFVVADYAHECIGLSTDDIVYAAENPFAVWDWEGYRDDYLADRS